MAVQSLNPDSFQFHLFCRLCGTKDTISMIEFSDTYSFMGKTTGILDLLKKTSVIFNMEEEFEKFMPKCICVTCFNMAVDFQVFLDSAMNNQKRFLDQIISYNNHSIMEEQERNSNSYPETQMESLVYGNEILVKVENNIPPDSQNLPGNKKKTSDENTVQEINYNLPLTQNDNHLMYRKKETVIEIKQRLQAGTQNLPNFSTDKSAGTDTNFSTPILKEDGKSESVGLTKDQEYITSIDLHKAEKEKSIQKSIACTHCNKLFHRPSELKSHLLSHSNDRPHKCSTCSMSFKYQRNLKEHLSIHSKNPDYICAVCGMTFRQRSNLLKHEKSHKDFEKKRYVCDICKKTFSQSSHLSTHIKNVHHNSNKQYSCMKCDSTLKCMSSLRRHISTVHANNSKYFCSDCNKGFSSLQNYQGHVRSHTGERPYSCNSCNKSFTTTKALSRHRLTHQGIRTHKCPECEKTFLESGDLKRHMKRHINRKNKLKHKSNLKSTIENNTEMNNVQTLVTNAVATPVVSRIESVNLMMLTEPLIISGSQQLLGTDNNSQSQPILTDSDKVDSNTNSNHVGIMANNLLQSATSHICEPINKSTPVTQVSQPSITKRITDVVSSTDVNPSQPLESVTLVNESPIDQSSKAMNGLTNPLEDLAVITSTPADTGDLCDSSISLVHHHVVNTTSQCASSSLETNTIFTLASVRTGEYLPISANQYNRSDDMIDSANNHQNERVLSQARW